ncbi:MAG: hypothetical protein DRG30_03160 [Epsilonproteobacteria bacterium]|nr:MAG: hypothetical protein DRG30_03160 [Campylobacterota bacterium]
MQKFFILEGGNLVIALFFVLVIVFVTTRPFMPRGSFIKGIAGILVVVAILVGWHYSSTANRMAKVKSAFETDQAVVCESRMQRRAAQSVIIKKSLEWSMDGDNFISPNYNRSFHSARCIVK